MNQLYRRYQIHPPPRVLQRKVLVVQSVALCGKDFLERRPNRTHPVFSSIVLWFVGDAVAHCDSICVVVAPLSGILDVICGRPYRYCNLHSDSVAATPQFPQFHYHYQYHWVRRIVRDRLLLEVEEVVAVGVNIIRVNDDRRMICRIFKLSNNILNINGNNNHNTNNIIYQAIRVLLLLQCHHEEQTQLYQQCQQQHQWQQEQYIVIIKLMIMH
mmetsp:Transcript_48105/g.53614  ORF Transcript_48105/g.53614 Transcript_48105/m.53614 type:complete len:214 (-) Transcript_48105:120-761(-)